MNQSVAGVNNRSIFLDTVATAVTIKLSGPEMVDPTCMGANGSTLTKLRSEKVCPETREQIASSFSFSL